MKNTGNGKSKEISEGKFGRSDDRAKRIDTLTICLSLTRTLLDKTHLEARRQRSSLLWSIHRLHGKEGGEKMEGEEIPSTFDQSLPEHVTHYLMGQEGRTVIFKFVAVPNKILAHSKCSVLLND